MMIRILRFLWKTSRSISDAANESLSINRTQSALEWTLFQSIGGSNARTRILFDRGGVWLTFLTSEKNCSIRPESQHPTCVVFLHTAAISSWGTSSPEM